MPLPLPGRGETDVLHATPTCTVCPKSSGSIPYVSKLSINVTCSTYKYNLFQFFFLVYEAWLSDHVILLLEMLVVTRWLPWRRPNVNPCVGRATASARNRWSRR